MFDHATRASRKLAAMVSNIERLKAEQQRLILAEAAAAKLARQLAAELDAITSELIRLDVDTAAKHHAASARAIVNAARKARNEPPLDDDTVVPFPRKDR